MTDDLSRPEVTLANWQEPPSVRWAFQHMRELMPSHVIEASDRPLELPESPLELGAVALDVSWAPTLDQLLEATETDGFAVFHHGRLVFERYFGGMTPRTRHLCMSVSKSVVSCVAAGLAGDGLLDPDAPVEAYVPELAESGYAGARVRTLLDMRSGIRFREAYTDASAEVRVMERSMGWAPAEPGDPPGMYPYILTIEPEGEHGDVFVYRSVDTDTLGWVCEQASGQRMADLIAERVWRPMGAGVDAEITADPLGHAVHDGGLSAALRDLGRFGLMLADLGRVGDRQVLPAEWFETALAPPDDVVEAFAESESAPYLPGGWYRNQFWMIPGDDGPIMMALGIHGQMVFVERSAGLVGVKLSSWPDAQDSDKLHATIAAFRQLGRTLD